MADYTLKAEKITAKLTQEQLIENVANKFATEMYALSTRKAGALSVFRQAADELSVINKETHSAVSNAKTLVNILNAEIADGEASIEENEIVRQKMLDIITAK